jgi:dTDP-4-dehydrorhamnose 3,5-epimerase
MKIIQTKLPGLILIKPRIFEDERGYFFESFHQGRYSEAGIENNFIQDNESRSTYGVVRGLHFQLDPYSQTKLVRVIKGKVFDVVVDLREGSPTYGEWQGFELSGKNKNQLLVPRGFAHGFSVLSKTVILNYKCDNLYSFESERAIRYNDPQLKINWKIHENDMIVSEKDRNATLFSDSEMNFKF